METKDCKETMIRLLLCRKCDGQIMSSRDVNTREIIYLIEGELKKVEHKCEVLNLTNEEFSEFTTPSKENFSCKCKCTFDIHKYTQEYYKS